MEEGKEEKSRKEEKGEGKKNRRTGRRHKVGTSQASAINYLFTAD